MPGILSGTRFSSLFAGSGSPKVENPPSAQANFVLQLLWIVGAILAIIVPAIIRARKMNEFQQYFNMMNWQEAQQQMQENYNQAQQNGYQWGEMRGTYDINQCKWFQWNCFSYYINENGEPEPAAGWYPSWYSGWAVTQEEREQMLEDGTTPGGLKFVYAWQLLMFLVITCYGLIVIRQNRVMTGLLVALVVFGNMSFLSLFMLAEGSIVTDAEYIQDIGGFYGQFSVLMFITDVWYILFCTAFAVVFGMRMYSMHKKTQKEALEAYVKDGEPLTGYTTMEEDTKAPESNAESTPATCEDGDYVKVV